MLFEYPLTIPANTTKAAAVTLDALLAAGSVTRVDVQFPSGCAGLVHCTIWRHDHQVWPVNLDNDIAGDDIVVSWPESYDLAEEPFSFTIRAWNLDDTYEHTITARFALLSFEEVQQSRQAPSLLQRIAQVLGGKP
jgi:hypothetical protein